MKEVVLTKGKVALVDDADYDSVSQFKWSYTPPPRNKRGSGYAMRGTPTIYLHKFLADPPPGYQVDHRDGDGLNCQRYNLRVCTRSQNVLNVSRHYNKKYSQFKGVHPRTGRTPGKVYGFFAQVTVQGVHYKSRKFDTEIEAAHAYNALAAIHHGEFAKLNVIP